eukprot:scaffold233313_cov36-Prasinocladus_malaysianus.AAC.1
MITKVLSVAYIKFVYEWAKGYYRRQKAMLEARATAFCLQAVCESVKPLAPRCELTGLAGREVQGVRAARIALKAG